VYLAQSGATLLSGSAADLAALNTLCWVEGELIAYQTATLTGTSRYALTTLARGVYGTPIAAHPVGAPFVRLDGAPARYPFGSDKVGASLYIKLPSFNAFGGGAQSPDEVEPVRYLLRGTALSAPLPTVTGLTTAYVAGIVNLSWAAASDFRAVDYEIRAGATPQSAQVIGRTPLTQAPAYGDGTYWVAAHYALPGGGDVYSASWASVVVAGAQLTRNVIAGWDECAGTPAGAGSGVVVTSGVIQLAAAGNLLSVSNIRALPDVYWYGGVAPSGTYTVPASRRVTLTRVAACAVSMSATVSGVWTNSNIRGAANVLALPDFRRAVPGGSVSAIPQIRTSQDGVTWGAWQDWLPASYVGKAFDFQLVLSSSNSLITAVATRFAITVDVPDRVDEFTFALPAAGGGVTYATPFNGSSGGPGAAPSPQVTILGASAGDDVSITNVTLAGFSAQVVNAGVGVARTIAIRTQGY
jgi:hypothetical protein